jgi:hypothetical protein
MYSITNSPGMALDLAHALQHEHRRQAGPTRRTPKQPKVESDRKASWWPTRPWTRRPAVLA